MPRLLAAIALSLAAAPAGGATEWRQSRDVEIRLSSFDIQPGTIRLKAGEPVRLNLVNVSQGDHSFSAPDFFRAAEVRSRDQRKMAGGGIDVPAGEARELVLVPAPGRYSARCGNFIHWILGMRSEIIVE